MFVSAIILLVTNKYPDEDKRTEICLSILQRPDDPEKPALTLLKCWSNIILSTRLRQSRASFLRDALVALEQAGRHPACGDWLLEDFRIQIDDVLRKVLRSIEREQGKGKLLLVVPINWFCQ